MTSPDDELLVFWDQDVEPVGLVRRAASGVGATFRYLSSQTPPTRRVSHSLPVSLGTTEVEATFFEGLLPDGVQRERLARRLGVSDASTFTMLRAVGGDCEGAARVARHHGAATVLARCRWCRRSNAWQAILRRPRCARSPLNCWTRCSAAALCPRWSTRGCGSRWRGRRTRSPSSCCLTARWRFLMERRLPPTS